MGRVIGAGAIWLLLTLIIDFVGWVMIKHPWSLSLKAFYIDDQPNITFIYLVIFLSPLIAYLLMRL